MTESAQFRCGVAVVIGRPNVGKSTLLNRLVGQKISITSPRPQTTRHAIRGILTQDAFQLVFVDTPGFQTLHRSALNSALNRSVTGSLRGVDLALFVVEACRYGRHDKAVLDLVARELPVVVVINKIDLLARREELLPFMHTLSGERAFAAIVPVCARRGEGVAELLRSIVPLLPTGPAMFGADEITDRSERFVAAEFVREKLFHRLGDELPYGLTVEIERFEQEGDLRRIAAAIIVDRPGHKAMVIGKGGSVLKAVGAEARQDMEKLFGGKVFLETWVKVRSGWTDDERAVKSLGYE